MAKTQFRVFQGVIRAHLDEAYEGAAVEFRARKKSARSPGAEASNERFFWVMVGGGDGTTDQKMTPGRCGKNVISEI